VLAGCPLAFTSCMRNLVRAPFSGGGALACAISSHSFLTPTTSVSLFPFIYSVSLSLLFLFFFQAEDGIRDLYVTGVQTCALPISGRSESPRGSVLRARLPPPRAPVPPPEPREPAGRGPRHPGEPPRPGNRQRPRA